MSIYGVHVGELFVFWIYLMGFHFSMMFATFIENFSLASITWLVFNPNLCFRIHFANTNKLSGFVYFRMSEVKVSSYRGQFVRIAMNEQFNSKITSINLIQHKIEAITISTMNLLYCNSQFHCYTNYCDCRIHREHK